jgi:hypothetical protein
MVQIGSSQIENGNAMRGKTEKLIFQATEHAGLLTTALQSGFLVSAAL